MEPLCTYLTLLVLMNWNGFDDVGIILLFSILYYIFLPHDIIRFWFFLMFTILYIQMITTKWPQQNAPSTIIRDS